MNSLLGLADGLVANLLTTIVGTIIETGTVRDLKLRTVKAGVSGDNGASGVIEADLSCIPERVVDKPGAVGLLDLDALLSCNNHVLLEYVVVGSSGIAHFGFIRAKVRVDAVPE